MSNSVKIVTRLEKSSVAFIEFSLFGGKNEIFSPQGPTKVAAALTVSSVGLSTL